ncbi:putative single-stranded DNA-binding protein [Helianthus annuus]|nr:putative single-stranded DNA-binding protein [Helianthus annuus]
MGKRSLRESCKKQKNYAANGTGSVEELWQAFFANPVDWWDNRKNKVTDTSPTYHIFVHSHTPVAKLEISNRGAENVYTQKFL